MQVREIILDTETTGLRPHDGHRIIEIGAIEMIDKVVTGRKFTSFINPERNVPEEAYRIHGISAEYLADKPLFKEIAEEFLDFVAGCPLVIHNAKFDIAFLNHELSMIKLSSFDLAEAICTLDLARKKFPGARASLDALCRRFNIDNKKRVKHGADIDAELLAEVYIELTGGKQSSFTLVKDKLKLAASEQNIKKTAQGNNIIIKPNSEELAAHQDFIEKIIAKK